MLPSADSFCPPLRFDKEAAPVSGFRAVVPGQGTLHVLMLGSMVGPTSLRHERGKWLTGIGGGPAEAATLSGLLV